MIHLCRWCYFGVTLWQIMTGKARYIVPDNYWEHKHCRESVARSAIGSASDFGSEGCSFEPSRVSVGTGRA